jgi:hypothetical protein
VNGLSGLRAGARGLGVKSHPLEVGTDPGEEKGSSNFVKHHSCDRPSQEGGERGGGRRVGGLAGGRPPEVVVRFKAEGDLVAPMEVKSQSIAWRVSEGGKFYPLSGGPTAHVRQEHQLCQALTRVPGALPRGQIIAVKAWLMAGTEVGVAEERRARTCSKFPCVWSKGEFAELLRRASFQYGGLPARALAWR